MRVPEAAGTPGGAVAGPAVMRTTVRAGRPALLPVVDSASPIGVTDPATASGVPDTGVSRALRPLRTAGPAEPERDGRIGRRRGPSPPAPSVPPPGRVSRAART